MNKPMHHIIEGPGTAALATGRQSAEDPISQKSLQLTRSLQTSLDPERLIEIFSLEAGSLIVHQGMSYSNDNLDIDLNLGRQAPHSCSYKLMLADEPLGRLTFRRDRRFNERELEVLENLLCSLLYPLRNALLYQDALQLAQKDPLTGICNRAAFDETLNAEISHALRHDAQCSMLILDIDHFKAINDRFGHIIGDCALKAVADMARRCKRDGDLLFRYGGEEFVVLMRDTGLAGAALLAERIRSHIAGHSFECSGATLHVSVSVGVSAMADEDTPEALFKRADDALYEAKKSGRNRVCLSPHDSAESVPD